MYKKIAFTTVLISSVFYFSANAQEVSADLEDVISIEEVNQLQEGSDAELQALCGNILDPARERRHALQRQELQDLRDELQSRIAQLEQRKEELKIWATRREEFASKAQGVLVEVYAKMPAEAAAERMAQMQSQLSAALLMKLKPRNAAAILSEMPTEKATFVSSIMAASAEIVPDDS